MSTILSLRSRFFVRGDVGQKSGCRICVGFRRTASLPNDTDAVINGGDGIGRPEKELVAASLNLMHGKKAGAEREPSSEVTSPV